MAGTESNDSADQPVRVVARRVGSALVLSVAGELDVDTVDPLRRALAAAVYDQEDRVVLDLAGVAFCDSSTVNELLRAHSALGEGRLRIAAPSPFVARLMRMIGLDTVLTVCDDVDGALRDAAQDA